MNSSSSNEKNGKKISPVFIYSAIIAAIVVLIGAIFPTQFDSVTNEVKMWITDKLGWYYLILTTIIVSSVFSLSLVQLGNLN